MCTAEKFNIFFANIGKVRALQSQSQLQLHVHNERFYWVRLSVENCLCVCVCARFFAMNVPNYRNIRQTFYKYQIECINEQ